MRGKTSITHPDSQIALIRLVEKIKADAVADLELEINACLELEPLTIRCREGGGPENLAASLALTMAASRDMRRELTEALRLLHDYQNGCPLPKYEQYWDKAMRLSEHILPLAEKSFETRVEEVR